MEKTIVFINDNPPDATEKILPPILAQAILNRMERDSRKMQENDIIPDAS